MMQRITSKRLGRRAYFRSLLIVGLVAGGVCITPATLSAQSSGGATELRDAPPSLDYVPGLGQPLPSIDTTFCRALSAPSKIHNADASRRIVQLLGLAAHDTKSIQASRLAVPSQIDVPQVPQVTGVRQAQFQSVPKAPANDARRAAAASGVAHAYLVESNPAGSQGGRPSLLRPLSSLQVEDGDSAPSDSAPGDGAQVEDAPIVGGPVKYDAALSGLESNVAPAMPVEESESLLDLDLSALTAQGPTGASQRAAGASQTPTSVLVVEDSSPKLIGTEAAAPGKAQPVTRAPQLTLSDSYPENDQTKRTPVKALLASTVSKATRVNVHESFAPRANGGSGSFHLSDDETYEVQDEAPAVKLAPQHNVIDIGQPVAQPDQVAEHAPVEELRLTEDRESIEESQLVEAPKPVDERQTLASAPALLPPAPALLGMTEPSADTAKPTTNAALVTPFVPGTEGLVVKANRPGLDQGQPRTSDTRMSAPSQSEPRAPEIASSSSHRPLSLRISGSAMPDQSSSTSAPEQHSLNDQNPIAMTGPVVKAVKQVVTPAAQPAAFAAQSTDAPEPSSESQLVQDLMKTIKKSFPGSRVELKTDEEGLVAEGVAASESEAKKILAMVRKTALCPVADHIITKR